jgi:hypothetical protein
VATGDKNSDLIHRIAGSFVVVLGGLLIVPGVALLFSHLFFYTVGLKPSWLPWLLGGMAALGAFLIFSGIAMMKRRAIWDLHGQ